MTRRSFLSMLLAVVTFAGIIAASNSATAQQNLNICSYVVDVAGIPPCCFPITLTTEWSCNPGIHIDTKVIPGNGVFNFPLNPPGAPPCPPACLFNWASLNGIVNPAALNQVKQYVINGCCYGLNPVLIGGQVYIFIRPCIVN